MPEMTVEQHLEAIDERRRDDIRRLHELIRAEAPQLDVEVTAETLGYGPFHYRYESGREGDSHLLTLANRKQHIALYVNAVEDDAYVAEGYAERLPKASIGRSCVRIKRLDDLDQGVLRELVRAAVAAGPAGSA